MWGQIQKLKIYASTLIVIVFAKCLTKISQTSSVHNIHYSSKIVSNFCLDHGADSKVHFEEFQTDLITNKLVVGN